MTTPAGDDETGPATDDASPAPGRITRRRAITGAATVGITVPLLSACADDSATATGPDPDASGASAPTSPSATSEASGGETTDPTSSTDGALAATEDIPVGSGVVFADSRVVVTQPEAGDLKCFSAVCTHTGCIVAEVTTTILCRCHGSSFDISTGEVLGGPAAAPLSAVDFTIDKDQVVLS